MRVMRIHSFWPLSMLAIVLACQPVTQSVEAIDETYDVYSAFLNSIDPAPEQSIVVTNTTVALAKDLHPQTPWSLVANRGHKCFYEKDPVACQKLNDPAWATLFEAVKQPPYADIGKLSDMFRVDFPIRLLSDTQISQLYQYEEGKERAPFIFRFSTPIYDAEAKKAAFLYAFNCGPNCGRRELVLLEKVDQQWVVVDVFTFGIS